MHGNMVTFMVSVAVVVFAAGVFAQPPGPSQGLPEGGSAGPRDGFRPPPDPLREALDANHDHQIDADEIKNASAAILTLDADGDGMLGHEELRPPMPPEMQGRAGRGFDRGQRRGGAGEGGPGPGGARRPGGREGRGGPDGGGPAAGGARGTGGGQGPSPERFIERAMRFDADGDGRLSREELQAFAAEMMQRRGGPGGPPGGEGPGGEERPPRPPRPEE